jgi:translation initiation factor IF-2
LRTEVKSQPSSVGVAELGQEFGLKPGQVLGVLDDLGIPHEGGTVEADVEELELVRESLRELDKSAPLSLPANATPRDVAQALGVPLPEIQKVLMTKLRVMATLTTPLSPEVAATLVEGYGLGVKVAMPTAPKPRRVEPKPKPTEGAQPRPPVVTIMGHVDHGKTSLLDYIRKANVAAKEHGGITQHIGAYQVELPEGKITFLDTPGHAAFTAMRARGAQVTDIAVLVVAADDGIMPQTREAISHIQSAKVPMIVAVNKIDRPDANPDRVLQQLPEQNVIPEAFGGDTIVANVSAVTGEGVPHLLEMILLQAGILNLKADPKGPFSGVVIEAKLEKGRGPVATVLVQDGTLRIGDAVVVGNTYGRVRAMTDYRGVTLSEAGPSVPVELLGLSEAPMAGDKVELCEDEREAREIAAERAAQARIKSLQAPTREVSLADLQSKAAGEGAKELNLIVKADVQGSVEAVAGLIENIEQPEVDFKVIHSGVGTITESDVLLASASKAIVIGFNVKPEAGAKEEATRRRVEIRTYRVIYELIEDVEKAIKGQLEPKFEEQYQGTVESRAVFDLTRYGKVAGCHVTDGKVTRSSRCRVRRDGEVVYEGRISSLKHVKEDVREATVGFDCGIRFEDWTEFKEGDVIEAFDVVQVNP